jgi:oxidase EvaA
MSARLQFREGWVRRVPLSECRRWRLRDGALRHDSGRYFALVAARDADGCEHLLAEQREIGTLAILARAGEHGPQWLLQDKVEPGNTGGHQWAASVQATRSNQERVHGGKPTPLLDWLQVGEMQVDVEQSEQGSQFLGKFNRNLLTWLPEGAEPTLPEGWRWHDATALRRLLLSDFALNTDARSVLACAGPALLRASDPSAAPRALAPGVAEAFDASLQTLRPAVLAEADAALDAARGQAVSTLPIESAANIRCGEDGITDRHGRLLAAYFESWLPSREVTHWWQPLLVRALPMVTVLQLRLRGGLLEACVQPMAEPGFEGRAEFGPSAAWCHGDPAAPRVEGVLLARVRQSDEGGRFFQQVSDYRLLLAPENQALTGTWLSLGELWHLLRQRGRAGNELRSLASLLLALA